MQKGKDSRKLIVCAVILLFFGVACSPSIYAVDNRQKNIQLTEGNTLYVGGSGPNNYTKIQDAINDSSDGDTIYVYDDSSPYYENLAITVSIDLIGENKDTTIIDGRQLNDTIKILSNNTTISTFTIINGIDDPYVYTAGIEIRSSGNNIVNNNILNNRMGIHILSDTTGNKIYGNLIKNNFDAAIHTFASNNEFFRNTIIQNDHGFFIRGFNNRIYENNIFLNGPAVLGGEIKDFFQQFSNRNRCYNNYWGRPRIFPKPIFCLLTKVTIDPNHHFPPSVTILPWLQFDLNPAIKPYDIGGNN